jgi:hypothetical protein
MKRMLPSMRRLARMRASSSSACRSAASCALLSGIFSPAASASAAVLFCFQSS